MRPSEQRNTRLQHRWPFRTSDNSASFDSRLDAQESFSTSLDDTFATEAEVNSATSSLSSSLAVDIASNLSEITNLNSFSSSIESHLPSGVVSGSSQITDGSGIVSGSEFTGSVNVTDTINLAAQDPLPSGNIGDLAVSGSNLYFYNGSWTQVI